MSNYKKDSFLLYTEHKELVEQLTDEQAGVLFKSLFKYVSTGIETKLDVLSKLVFISIRQDLDRNAEKYEAFVERQRQNGLKGGRPKKEDIEETPEKNPSLFSKTQKSHNDNVNVNENDNVNENVNVNENENDLSFSHENAKSENERIVPKEKIPIGEKEREILEKYVRRKKLAKKSISAYINKIIQNGDHVAILEEERLRQSRSLPTKEEYSELLASIHDKRSAARVIYRFHLNGTSPPDEFEEVMEKYDLDTYDKLYAYSQELEKQRTVAPAAESKT